jgi:cell wall-associated NlpC family hydrolase
MANTFAPTIVPQGGSDFAAQYLARKNAAGKFDQLQRTKNTQDVATDLIDKSAGNIGLDQYGLVKDTQAPKPVDLSNTFNLANQSITKSGSLAADAAKAKNDWQTLKKAQDLAASYKVGGVTSADTSGLASNNSPGNVLSASQTKGSQAVALALQAYNNKTPYVWGGNSLTKGIDCSGLVQQVYSQMGIKVPRTTYEQAKSGSIVNLNQLMPGDLVFYNTGSSDPNGIGQYSHVAIYTGNGNIVDARNSRTGMQTGSIYNPGTPVLGVRPW